MAKLETATPEASSAPSNGFVEDVKRRGSLHGMMRRKSTIAFLMTLPLITLLIVLVAYPAGSAIYLSMLDRSLTKFVGVDNFARLFGSNGFWMLVYQTCLLSVTAVLCQAIIGCAAAHFMHHIPTRGQRKWRGMLLIPWVIPPAMSMLAWRQLFDPSFSAFNWILDRVGMERISWLAEVGWARFAVILATVWLGAPFFMIMYLASLKSVPEELFEAASIDGASWWQRTWHVTLPMTRNIIAITTLFSLIGSFAGFTIVSVLTNGGPLGATRVLATSAFYAGIAGGNFPIGAALSLCMVPVLAAAAVVILRGITRRGSEV
jgi:multiple sugar transport system permease protein